jgi:hypothetical protein
MNYIINRWTRKREIIADGKKVSEGASGFQSDDCPARNPNAKCP